MRSYYDVRRDTAGTAMGGSSMGGLVTVTIATLFPEIFGRILVFSPSVWWHRRAVLRAVRHPGVLGELFGRSRGLSDNLDIWLSIGLEEGEQAVDDARRLRDVIVAMRRGDQSKLRYVEYSDGAHTEASWAKQLPDALIPAASRRRLV